MHATTHTTASPPADTPTCSMMCAGQRGKDIDGVVRDLGKNPETGKSIAAENKGVRPPTHYLLLTTAELLSTDY